jgi:Tfp pilus assembly protein PilX
MKMHMVRPNKQIRGEQGFASLVVVLTLIIVLSLITLGFAQLIRREQNNALNKQLSSQAFYAAESGVNDVIKAINDGATNLGDTKTCTGSGSIFDNNQALAGKNPVIDSAHNVSYTCVLVNKQPNNLYHQNVGNPAVEDSNTNSWTVVGSTTTPLNAGLKISWQSYSKRSAVPASKNTAFLPHDSWKDSSNNGYMGVLQFSVTPLGGMTRQNLITNDYTAYLYPTSGAADTMDYTTTTSAKGAIKAASCTSGTCSITLNSLPGGPYLFHIASIYDSSDITLTPVDNTIKFIDTQAVIDVTGKAQDILRRIQVRYPLQNDVALPTDALEAQNICKRMATNAKGTLFFDTSGGSASSGPCYLQ